MLAPPQTENHELLAHIDLEKEIVRLKRQMNAVILAHFYQESEIQDLADFVGIACNCLREQQLPLRM